MTKDSSADIKILVYDDAYRETGPLLDVDLRAPRSFLSVPGLSPDTDATPGYALALEVFASVLDLAQVEKKAKKAQSTRELEATLGL